MGLNVTVIRWMCTVHTVRRNLHIEQTLIIEHYSTVGRIVFCVRFYVRRLCVVCSLCGFVCFSSDNKRQRILHQPSKRAIDASNRRVF